MDASAGVDLLACVVRLVVDAADEVHRETDEDQVGIGVEHGRGDCPGDGVLAGMDEVGVDHLADVVLVDGEYPAGAVDAEDGLPGDGALLVVDEALGRHLNVVHVVVEKDVAVLGLVAGAVHHVGDRECANQDSDRDCGATKGVQDFGTAVPLDWEPVEEASDCFVAKGTPSFNDGDLLYVSTK